MRTFPERDPPMKKFIAASTILALSLIGAPQAAAFSSGSSGSNIVQPLPEPKPTDLNEVLRIIASGYFTHYSNRGYTYDASAENIAQMYFEGTPSQKEYLRQELAAIGAEVIVETYPTSTYQDKYNQLVNTPRQPINGTLWGAYIGVNEYTITATLVVTH